MAGPGLFSVADKTIDLDLAGPEEGEIEPADLSGAAKKDYFASWRDEAECLSKALLGADAVKYNGEAATREYLKTNDGLVGNRARGEQGRACRRARRCRAVRAQRTSQGSLVRPLGLRNDWPYVPEFAQRPQRTECDDATSNHQHA